MKRSKVRAERAFLYFLAHGTHPRQVRAVIQHMTKDQYTALQEIALNSLKPEFVLVAARTTSKARRQLTKLNKGTLTRRTLQKQYPILKPFIVATLQFHGLG